MKSIIFKNKIAALDQKRQSLLNSKTQTQTSTDDKNNSGQFDNQLVQIQRERNELGEKVTFLSGKISSLKSKMAECKSKLLDIVNKLSTIKRNVTEEKGKFDSTYKGIRGETAQLSKDSSSARSNLEGAANKAHSMYQTRTANEKEIDSIINKLKSNPDDVHRGSVVLHSKYTCNVQTTNDYSGIENQSIDTLVREMLTPSFIKNVMDSYGSQISSNNYKRDELDFLAQRHYYYHKKQPKPFNIYSLNLYHINYKKYE